MLTYELALTQIWGFAFVLVRSAGILSALPVIGGSLTPTRIKVGLAVGVALVFTPVVGIKLNPMWLSPLNLAVGIGAEFLVGLTLGLGTRVLMAAVDMAGSLMGLQVGLGGAAVLDPVSRVQTPVFGQLLTILAALLFFQMEGHHIVLQALGASFTLIPPFGAQLTPGLQTDVFQIVQETLETGIKLALPVVIATFFVHLTLSIVGRAVPQMNILITSFPITISIGLIVLGLGLPMMALVFQQLIVGLEGTLIELLRELGRG